MKIFDIFLESFQGEKVLSNPDLVRMIGTHMSVDHTLPHDIRTKIIRRPDIRPDRQEEDKKRQEAWDRRATEIFIEAMDQWAERARSQGMVYNVQPGQYDQWMARRYAAGGTSWEDLDSRAPAALYDLNLLTRKRKIDPRHADVNGYRSVAELEQYIDTHYSKQRDELRKDDELERLAREAMAIKLADNEDYLLLAVVNRGAACKYGKGTRWCTSSTSSASYYNRYQEDSPLFILLDKKREGEKYQWHFTSHQFMDPADRTVEPRKIRSQYPNLLNDLVNGITANAELWRTAPWNPKLSPHYGYNTPEGAVQQIKDNVAQTRWRSFHNYFAGPIPDQQDAT